MAYHLSTLNHTRPGLPRVVCRRPMPNDAIGIWELVGVCPPLDLNSLYSYLLHCTDFADTCVVLQENREIVGWLSAYRQPNEPSTLFVWQIAIHPALQGGGLGKSMFSSLLKRPLCRSFQKIKATATLDNAPSKALFSAVARELNAPICHKPWFDRDIHFGGRQESEHLIEIGPFNERHR